ncbi:MAG: hypothetical protein JOZ77_00840 [Candidatus Eremiobacteraeota bacterium]|nr:hypothetical protein [Candidatus Eremiobacteraeota bacterium]
MRRFVLLLCSALLTCCAHQSGFSPLPGNAQSGDSATQYELPLAGTGYKLLYSFKGGSDAAYPYAPLTEINGEFYGTTYGGGGGSQWGTVFKVSKTGQEHVLYRFKAGSDGAHPFAGLTNLNGTLYGTTYQGGTKGSGTVFKISTAGEEHVVYSFKGGSDGQYPYCRLLALNGELYGTTYQGGVSSGWGVVFKVSDSGQEDVLYRFIADDKGTNDGAHPYAGLTDVGGTLYGTTNQGGTTGSGTVFKVSTAGKEAVVYSFKGGSDGQYPFARLLYSKGQLYGTTYQGGVANGWGTVFKVSTSGTERVLYRFNANDKGTHDGAHPYYGGLVAIGSYLYGTTYQGGGPGDGTVYKLSVAGGKDQILYAFKGGSDGQYPYAGVDDSSGTLYGTTYVGGGSGAGTVFKISP